METMHTLVLREREDAHPMPYNGLVGGVAFADGVSIERHDVTDWRVRRLLHVDDGGCHLYPLMRILRDDDEGSHDDDDHHKHDDDTPFSEPTATQRPKHRKRQQRRRRS